MKNWPNYTSAEKGPHIADETSIKLFAFLTDTEFLFYGNNNNKYQPQLLAVRLATQCIVGMSF